MRNEATFVESRYNMVSVFRKILLPSNAVEYSYGAFELHNKITKPI